MPPARKRPGDMTGRIKEQLEQENAATLKERAREIALMAEVQTELEDIPVDYSGGPTPIVDEVDIKEVELEAPTKTIMLNASLESMTFGAGKHYTFEEGRKYTVPTDLARRLDGLGYVWHGGYR